jgi:hypothetical protein
VKSLTAIPQRGKVRLILNMSLPVNKSLNNNIKKECMEKVRCLQKNPMQNVLPQIARFQVADQNTLLTRQVFGAEASASNFDTLRNNRSHNCSRLLCHLSITHPKTT